MSSSAEKVVCRSPWRFLVALVILAAAFVLMGLSAAVNGSTRIGLGVLAVCVALVAVRAVASRVEANSTGIYIRGLLRSRSLAWDSIRAIEPAIIDEKILNVWAPRVAMRDGELLIRQSAGYSMSARRPNRRVVDTAEALARVFKNSQRAR